MATYRGHPDLAVPTPTHAQTKAAKKARKALRQWAKDNPQRVRRDPKSGQNKVTRQAVTRAEVVAWYEHPAPTVAPHPVELDQLAGAPKTFARWALDNGLKVDAVTWSGTTVPKWRVNSPEHETDPGPPVEASQYRGDHVTGIALYVRRRKVAVLVTWHDGKAQQAKLKRRIGGRVETVTQADAKAALLK